MGCCSKFVGIEVLQQFTLDLKKRWFSPVSTASSHPVHKSEIRNGLQNIWIDRQECPNSYDARQDLKGRSGIHTPATRCSLHVTVSPVAISSALSLGQVMY